MIPTAASSYTFKQLFRNSVEQYGDCPALSYAGSTPLTYRDVAAKVNELHAIFDGLGIRKGDKVAILGQNMPNWGVAFFACVVRGVVAVPLLPDFHAEEIANILTHSEAKAIFASEKLLPRLPAPELTGCSIRILLDSLTLLTPMPQESPVTVVEEDPKEEDLAVLIYTSGTTGRSKGVMLSQKNIVWHTHQVTTIQPISKGMAFLSILPLSHMYENSLGLVLPIMSGATVYYLDRPPTPGVLLPALKTVRPHIMLSVPLIMDKIYRNQIKAKIANSKFLRTSCSLPFFRKLFFRLAGKKLMKTFGSRIIFFGIGGAKLDGEVEKFLKEAKFPYAIGYGLTECSPLLAGANPQQTKLGSTGFPMQGVTIRLENMDPETGIGEIVAKGDNIMMGYYKEPGMTREVLSEEGWFRTGDLGSFDAKGVLYIKGRSKNVILGASGENIYPEDIEAVINNEDFVLESLVIEKKGKLVAMVHLNYDDLEKHIAHFRQDAISRKNETLTYLNEKYEETMDHFKKAQESITDRYADFLEQVRVKANAKLNRFSQIHSIEAVRQPFEKTATQKIKRYLYFRPAEKNRKKDNG